MMIYEIINRNKFQPKDQNIQRMIGHFQTDTNHISYKKMNFLIKCSKLYVIYLKHRKIQIYASSLVILVIQLYCYFTVKTN